MLALLTCLLRDGVLRWEGVHEGCFASQTYSVAQIMNSGRRASATTASARSGKHSAIAHLQVEAHWPVPRRASGQVTMLERLHIDKSDLKNAMETYKSRFGWATLKRAFLCEKEAVEITTFNVVSTYSQGHSRTV